MTDTNLVPCQLELDGRMQTVLAPPGYAVRHRKALAWREAERWRRQKRRTKASAAYRKGPTDRRRLALLEAIQDCTSLCNSEERAEIMFFAIVGEPAEIFRPTFLIDWPSCDRSWQWSRHILALLRMHRDAGNPATEFIEAEAPDGGIFHEDLPDLIEVWRGTDRTRVRNMSWTTDRKVAETFATGMRGGAFPDPVVAHAFIPKQWVFYASNDRSEAEVVLDPRRLRKLTIEPFVISKTARFAQNYVNRTIHEEAISNSG